MFKKIIYLFLLVFFVTSCGGTFDNVKRGLTGAKKQSTDEFLIQKKDPLILPPDYENLPSPDEVTSSNEDILYLEGLLKEKDAKIQDMDETIRDLNASKTELFLRNLELKRENRMMRI